MIPQTFLYLKIGNGIIPSDNAEPTEQNKTVPRISMESKEVSGSISLRGARIDDITLTQYRETLEPESDMIRLLLNSNGERHILLNLDGVALMGLKSQMVKLYGGHP